MADNLGRFCPTCGQFMADYKTRQRVAKFAAEGLDIAGLAESVSFEPAMQEAEPNVILISTISGPVKVALALCVPVMVGSAVAFQYGAISGPLASMVIVGSFSAFVLMLGGNPNVIHGTAKEIEIEPAHVKSFEPELEPNVDEITRPGPHSISIRFYEPPMRPSGEPVPWEGICYACRRALNGRPFSERSIAGPRDAKISGPDFRLLAADFRRRGYTQLNPDRSTGFTPRGRTQIQKLASLPY